MIPLHRRWRIAFLLTLLPGALVGPLWAWAATPVITITIRDHLFYPSRIEIAAHTKVKLMIINQDGSAEEFESYELNREKVIPAGRKAAIFIGPLASGAYPFFGEFHSKTARGTIIAK